MAENIDSTPLAAPETSSSAGHSANLNFLNTTDLQAVRKMLAMFNYLYRIPLVPVAELSTKDVCIICKGDTDISFPMCETARSRVRLAKCGHILCLGCLSRSAFSSRGNQCPRCQEKFVQHGQGTCCEDEDTVALVRLVEILKRNGRDAAKEALYNIFATSHGASSLDSRKSVIIGAYWVAVLGDVARRGIDRAKLKTFFLKLCWFFGWLLCIGLAFWGLLALFSTGKHSLAVLVLLM